MRFLFTVAVVLAAGFLAGDARAETSRRRTAQQAQAAPAPQQGQVQPHVYSNRYSQQMYWRSWYPKYYGGIHARNLQNIGVPSGDIGIRGTPYSYGYGSPW